MSMTFIVRDSNARECARRFEYTVTASVVAGVRDSTSKCLVANFTHVLPSNGNSKYSEHVKILFDTIVQLIH